MTRIDPLTTNQDELFATWQPQPAAERLLKSLIADHYRHCAPTRVFSRRLCAETGIRLRDVLDHVVVTVDTDLEHRLTTAGFSEISRSGAERTFAHPGGVFPAIVHQTGEASRLAMRVESVEAFAAAHAPAATVEGPAGGPYRRLVAWGSSRARFEVVERHGYLGFRVPATPAERIEAARLHHRAFLSRQRLFEDPDEAFDHTLELARRVVHDLGEGWACALFLDAERRYWETRNHAGRIQRARQDAFGVGWCNHDHHTYDASREWFHRTIEILEALGFQCRERFYAGAAAGWGSQILEQPVTGAVVFADIDLAQNELAGDFAHAKLTPLPYLRRAGLWVALHGESILEAGLNHLECMFDQAALRAQLGSCRIEMMAPFSNFDVLYQELTVGECWPVQAGRLDRLLAAGLIDQAQAEEFATHGAIGSHFENLERNDGFKGFNQPGIDAVLRQIDPRRPDLVTRSSAQNAPQRF